MDSIPQVVTPWLSLYLDQLLSWFSEFVYNLLLQRDSNHILVRLHHHLDLSRIEQACAGFHHAAGPGAQPIHTVPHLVRALLVCCLFNWSLRQAEFQIRFNLVVKWFVGYAIFVPGPDHTTLERFHEWVHKEQHRTLFDEVLRQIDQQFADERGADQAGDTFAMQANAATQKPIDLIRHASRRLLASLNAADNESYQRVSAGLSLVNLLGPSDEVNEYHLDEAGRQARLQTTVIGAVQCLELVRAELKSGLVSTEAGAQEVRGWVDYLAKIIADEVELVRDEGGQISRVIRREKKEHGAYRLGSATDPEATHRVHGEDKIDFGYNVSLAVAVKKDSQGRRQAGFIRETQAYTGAKPDGATVAALVAAQQEHLGFAPEKLIFDAAAGTGKTMAAVAEVSGGHTQLVAPLVDYEKRSELFGPSAFRLSEDGTTLACPGGQESRLKYRSGSAQGYNFRFLPQQCEGCEKRRQCRQFEEGEPEEQAGEGESANGPVPQEGTPGEAGVAGAEQADAERAQGKGRQGKGKKGNRKGKKGSRKGKKGTARNVFISDYRKEVAAARAYQQSDEYKEDMRQRPLVERVIAELTRYNGARRARRIGTERADFQAKMCAVAYNLKLWVRRLGKLTANGRAQAQYAH